MGRALKSLQQSAFHDFQNNKSVKDCFLFLGVTFGDVAPTVRTVQKWYANFQNGRTSMGRRRAGGWPICAVTKQDIAPSIISYRRVPTAPTGDKASSWDWIGGDEDDFPRKAESA